MARCAATPSTWESVNEVHGFDQRGGAGRQRERGQQIPSLLADDVVHQPFRGQRQHQTGRPVDEHQHQSDTQAAAVRPDETPGFLPRAGRDALLRRAGRARDLVVTRLQSPAPLGASHPRDSQRRPPPCQIMLRFPEWCALVGWRDNGEWEGCLCAGTFVPPCSPPVFRCAPHRRRPDKPRASRRRKRRSCRRIASSTRRWPTAAVSDSPPSLRKRRPSTEGRPRKRADGTRS